MSTLIFPKNIYIIYQHLYNAILWSTCILAHCYKITTWQEQFIFSFTIIWFVHKLTLYIYLIWRQLVKIIIKILICFHVLSCFEWDTKSFLRTWLATLSTLIYLRSVIIFGLRFAFFTHISGEKRTVSKYVR